MNTYGTWLQGQQPGSGRPLAPTTPTALQGLDEYCCVGCIK